MNVQISKSFKDKSKIVQDDKNLTTSQMTSLARYVGFGLSAATITFFNSTSPFAMHFVANYKVWILISSAFGCIAIVLDYFQYHFGYRSSLEAADRLRVVEHASANTVAATKLFDSKSFNYRARKFCFEAKSWAVGIGSAIFIILLIRDTFSF